MSICFLSSKQIHQSRGRANMLYVDGEFKLAHHLASLAVASHTERWSALAEAGSSGVGEDHMLIGNSERRLRSRRRIGMKTSTHL